MAAVQGTAKSGGSCPEYVGAPLQFVVLSTLLGTCYSLRGHCAHSYTIHAHIHGYAHTCSVHAIDLMDAIFSQRTESHKNAIAGYSWP